MVCTTFMFAMLDEQTTFVREWNERAGPTKRCTALRTLTSSQPTSNMTPLSIEWRERHGTRRPSIYGAGIER